MCLGLGSPTSQWKPNKNIPIRSGDTGGVSLHLPRFMLQISGRFSRVNVCLATVSPMSWSNLPGRRPKYRATLILPRSGERTTSDPIELHCRPGRRSVLYIGLAVTLTQSHLNIMAVSSWTRYRGLWSRGSQTTDIRQFVSNLLFCSSCSWDCGSTWSWCNRLYAYYFGRRISFFTCACQATEFLLQRSSVAIQHNAAAVL